MATESIKVSTSVVASTTTYGDIYPPTSNAYTATTNDKVLVGGVETAITKYNVVNAAVKPADYDTLEIMYAWTNEGGTASVVYGVQTSADGANWVTHTTATGAITAAGGSLLEVTGFQKFLRLYYTESGTGTIDVSAALTFKKKVA
jgi:hypothetical protein